MNIDKEREWFHQYLEYAPAQMEYGGYEDPDVAIDWRIWRARAALDEQKAGPSNEEIKDLAATFQLHDTAFCVGGPGQIVSFARALLSKYAANSSEAPVNDQDDGKAKEDIYEEVYDNLCSILKPHIDAQKLPPSVTEAVEYLVRQWASTTNEQDVKDAQRYRWLKSQMRAMSVDMSGQHSWTLARSLPRAPSVDAACDAGIAAIAQQGKG